MFKFDLEQNIWYLLDNKVHFAPVLARRLVEFSRDKVNQKTAQSLNSFYSVPIKAYLTCHGEIPESKAFASRADLAKWVAGD